AFIETGVTADNKRWDFEVDGEEFHGRAVNDAVSVGTKWVAVNRTGTTIDTVNFPNGTLQYGSVEVGFRDIPRGTSLTRGQVNAVSAGFTLNTSSLSAGYTYCVYNDSASAITITQGSGVTLRLA